MSTLITVLHVIVCLFLMLTVLLQSGKGGGMGAAFGGSSAGTVFGGSGASGFLKRLTAIAGSIFMVTSIILAYLSSKGTADSLDSFGKEQDEISEQKDKAKTRALKTAKQLNGSGAPVTPGSGSGKPSMTPLTPMGSNATPPPAGSASTPEKPATPPEKPATPPPAGSNATKPATPTTPPGSGSATKPAAGSNK